MALDSSFWKKYFDVYDVLNELIPYQNVLKTLTERLELWPGMTVLDAGCGTGNLVPYLLSKNATVSAIDYSPEGIAKAKEKHPEAVYKKADLTKPLPFKDSSFDRVVSNNAIYTLPPPARPALFKEFARVLKPGGRIVVSNIRKGFAPFSIYTAHLKEEVASRGVTQTFIHACTLIIPTIRILYYNRRIVNEGNGGAYEFLTEESQRTLLQGAGFVVQEETRVYANNAVLTVAQKDT